MDWFDLLAVQGTFESLLQYHSSEASVLWCSAFFMVQLSHPYMTTGMQETQLQSLSWEDPLEKGMTTHSSRGDCWATGHGVAMSGTQLSN